MTSKPNSTRIFILLMIIACCTLAIAGCGGGSESTPPELPPLDTEKLAAALPSGVTLQTPVRPDKAYGESAKTVEDALKSLLATVKDKAIYDTFGHKIRFQSPGKPAGKSKQAEAVIYLAN